MKKLTSFLVVLTVVMVGTALFADSISQLEFQSSQYNRTLNRNASTDADATYYNPAGTAFMEDGLHLQAGTDIIIEKVTAKELLAGDDAERKSFIPYFARFYAVYKTGPLAVNFGVLPFYGGGFSFEGDTAATYGNADEISATKIQAGPQLGVAYALNDMIALGLSGRMAVRFGKGTIDGGTYDGGTSEFSGMWYGTVLSLAAKPVDGLVAALKFEYNFKYDSTDKNDAEWNTLFTGGTVTTKTEVDSEAQMSPKLGIGLSYMAMDNLKVETSFNYYLHSMVELDDTELSDSNDNGYDAGIAFEYGVMDGLVASLGYLYTSYGVKDLEDSISLMSNDMDHHDISIGAGYTVSEGLDLNLGFRYRIVPSVESSATNTSGPNTEYTKTRYFIGIGATYKAM